MDRNRSSMHSSVSQYKFIRNKQSLSEFCRDRINQVDHGQTNVLIDYNNTGIAIEQVSLVSKLVEHIHIIPNDGIYFIRYV